MVYKILSLFFGLVITALSIEWKGLELIKPLRWIKSKGYKTKNVVLIVSFFLALLFGIIDFKVEAKKDKTKEKIAEDNRISLNKKIDTVKGQLDSTSKDLKILQKTDSNIYVALNRTKLYYDDKSKAIKPQYGFKPELLGIYTKPDKKEDNTKSQPSITLNPTKPQSNNPLTQWYIKHWGAQLQQARTSYVNDSSTLHNVSEYHLGRLQSTRIEEISNASKALERDRTNIKNYTDSLNYWQNHK